MMTLDEARKFLDPKTSGRKRGRPTKEVSAKIAEAKLVVKAAKAAETARKAEEAKAQAEAELVASSQPKVEETPAPVTETVSAPAPVGN